MKDNTEFSQMLIYVSSIAADVQIKILEMLSRAEVSQDQITELSNKFSWANEVLFQYGAAKTDENSSLRDRMQNYEAMLIESSFRRHNGSITSVMEELQLPRRTLNEKMVKHGILSKDF